MPRKSSPLLQKVSNIVKDSIFIMKTRKPNIPRLILSLKKSKKLKKLILRKHYNYRYIQEYQFSASSTPLIHHYRKPLKKRSYQDMYSMCFIFKCLGMCQNEDQDRRFSMDLSSRIQLSDSLTGLEIMALQSDGNEVVEKGYWDSGSEDDSVDEKAEKFIKKFYKEMRKQRQEALSRVNSLSKL